MTEILNSYHLDQSVMNLSSVSGELSFSLLPWLSIVLDVLSLCMLSSELEVFVFIAPVDGAIDKFLFSFTCATCTLRSGGLSLLCVSPGSWGTTWWRTGQVGGAGFANPPRCHLVSWLGAGCASLLLLLGPAPSPGKGDRFWGASAASAPLTPTGPQCRGCTLTPPPLPTTSAGAAASVQHLRSLPFPSCLPAPPNTPTFSCITPGSRRGSFVG